jgi:trigger factor
MHIEREDIGPLLATLKVKLTPEDYVPGVERALKEQRRTAVWPGFRPGQVPMTIVRKRVGKAVLVNEVERLVGSSMDHYIRSNNLRVLGQPLPNHGSAEQNDWNSPGDFHFTYDMGLAPTFDLELGKEVGVEYPVVKVDDALVAREASDMARRFGGLTDAEVSGAEDLLLGHLIELDEDGSIREGGIFSQTTITLSEVKNEAVRGAFLGKAKGEEVRVDPHHLARDHEDLARMLNVEHERVNELKGDMLFRIAEIKRLEPLEVGQELFDRVYGKGAVTDIDQFHERVREGLVGTFGRESDLLYKRLVLRTLLLKASIELPDAFLKRWILTASDKPVTLEEVEANYANYAASLKAQLVEDRILQKYGLEAKGEEIDAFAKRYVADQFAQFGMPEPPAEEVQKIAARMMADRDQIKRMRDAIVDRKVMAHFKAMNEPTPKELTFDEFVNLARTV